MINDSADSTAAPTGRLIRFKCNFRELRERDSRRSQQNVADDAGIKRDLYNSMESGYCDAFKMRAKSEEAELMLGMKSRKERIAAALGVEVSELVCEPLKEPYYKKKKNSEPSQGARKRKKFKILEITAPKFITTLDAKDFPVVTMIRVLATTCTIPGLTLEELSFVAAAVHTAENDQARDTNRPLTLGETEAIVKIALNHIVQVLRKKKSA